MKRCILALLACVLWSTPVQANPVCSDPCGVSGSTVSTTTVTTTTTTTTTTISSALNIADRQPFQYNVMIGATGTPILHNAFGLTATEVTGYSSATDATGIWGRFLTGAVSGNQAGVRVNNITRYDHLPNAITRMTTGAAVTSERVWVGFGTGGGSVQQPDSDTPLTHSAVFRHSTVASDTNWQALTSDGSTTQTTDTGVLVVAATQYIMEIRVVSASRIEFYINNALVAANTTTLPTASSVTTYGLHVYTQTAAGRSFRLSWFTLNTPKAGS